MIFYFSHLAPLRTFCLLSLAILSTACKTTLQANFNSNDYQWVGSTSPKPYSTLDLANGGLSSWNPVFAECADFQTDWNNIQTDLANIHNELVVNKPPTVSAAAAKVIAPPLSSPAFLVSFTNDSLNVAGGGKFQFTNTVSVQGDYRQSDVSLGLALAKITTRVSLKQKALDCVRKNACVELGKIEPLTDSNGKPIPPSVTYISSVLYGTSLVLRIEGAERKSNDKIRAAYGDYGGELTFDLDAKHVSVLASFFGSVNNLETLNQVDEYFKTHTYDLPEIFQDLNDKRIIKVMQRWDQIADKRNVVALILGEVKTADCAK